MRAIYYFFERVEKGTILSITGEVAHHLNVVRIKANESILILNGAGASLIGKVVSVAKNKIEIFVETSQIHSRLHSFSLALAMPKKDAFEDILKIAVELGIRNIYPLTSEYSQFEYAPSERNQRILESALIQSNNPFLPEIHFQNSLKNFIETHSNKIIFFNSQKNNHIPKMPSYDLQTILIGPEGGFSSKEVSLILGGSQVEQVHLATPILRAPTAVASSVGYLLAKKNHP